MKKPTTKLKHPGHVLSERHFQPLNISVTDFAEALQVSRVHISMVLNAKKGIGYDVALRLEAAGLGSARTWITEQALYDFEQWVGANGLPANVKRLKR